MGLNGNAHHHGDESNPLANKSRKRYLVTQVILKILAAIFSIASIVVMVKSGQSTELFGIVIEAKYTYASAFKFLLGANIAICGLVVTSLISICAIHVSKSNSRAYFYVFLQDLIAMTLLISASGAATAIGYVGENGQSQSGWAKICDNTKKFCNYIAISIGLADLSFLCLFILTIITFKRAQH